MANKVKIIGVGGSLEGISFSLFALKHVIGELSSLGAETVIYDIKEMKLPLYDYSAGNYIPTIEFKSILNSLHSANGIILSSPEYHGTVSAAFKNFVDYLEFLAVYNPPYLTGKPVGCISIGGGANSGFFTLSTLINIVHNLRGITVSSNVVIPNVSSAFNDSFVLTDEDVKRRLSRLAEDVFYLASRLS